MASQETEITMIKSSSRGTKKTNKQTKGQIRKAINEKTWLLAELKIAKQMFETERINNLNNELEASLKQLCEKNDFF